MKNVYRPGELQAALDSTSRPQLLDVRRVPVFEESRELIAGAIWRDPERVAEWSGELDSERPVVVYCVHGHQVSQGCASRLSELGFDAAYLDGGIEGWKAAGGRMAGKSGSPSEMSSPNHGSAA